MKKLYIILNLIILLLAWQTVLFSQMDVSLQPTNPTCNGYQDGQVDLTVTGATGQLTYQWSNGEISEDINNLSAGEYIVTVTEGSSPEVQTFDWNYNLSENIHIIILNSSAINVPGYIQSCDDYLGVFYQSNSGSLECGAYVSVCDCMYIEANGDNPIINGDGFLPGDDFYFKLFITSENLEIDLTPTYSSSPWVMDCYDDFGFSDVISLSGVLPEYEPVTTNVIAQVTLMEPELLVAVAGDCQSRFIGFEPLYTGNYLEASATGGVAPYSYSWSGPNFTTSSYQQDVVVTPIVPTTYSLTVTDANLCSSTSDVFIDVIDVKAECKGNKKVQVCHVPPGNPANMHEICISINALCAHLNNHGGDQVGPCNNPCLTDLDPNKSTYYDSYDDISEDYFNIYPNPSYGTFSIDFMVENDEEITINLIDVTGKTLEVVFKDNAISYYNYELNISRDLLPGMYTLQFINDGEIENKKIMIVD